MWHSRIDNLCKPPVCPPYISLVWLLHMWRKYPQALTSDLATNDRGIIYKTSNILFENNILVSLGISWVSLLFSGTSLRSCWTKLSYQRMIGKCMISTLHSLHNIWLCCDHDTCFGLWNEIYASPHRICFDLLLLFWTWSLIYLHISNLLISKNICKTIVLHFDIARFLSNVYDCGGLAGHGAPNIWNLIWLLLFEGKLWTYWSPSPLK